MNTNLVSLRLRLAKLRSGDVPDEKVYGLLHQFGELCFFEAKAEVENYLQHDDPQLRYIALNVLALHWKCAEHRNTCENYLFTDEDSDNRRLAAMGLAAILEGSQDRAALKLLLRVFRDVDEERHVRDSAYSAILYILGRPVEEQPSAVKKLDHAKDVNWDLIRLASEIAESQR